MIQRFVDNQYELVDIIESTLLKDEELDFNVRRARAYDMARFLLEIVAWFVIKLLADSIGSQSLRDVLRIVFDNHKETSYRLVDLQFRLDFDPVLPQRRLETLTHDVDEDTLSADLIRYMVAEHVYMYPLDQPIRQKLCDKYRISYPIALKRKRK
jgi:hypothetical protein